LTKRHSWTDSTDNTHLKILRYQWSVRAYGTRTDKSLLREVLECHVTFHLIPYFPYITLHAVDVIAPIQKGGVFPLKHLRGCTDPCYPHWTVGALKVTVRASWTDTGSNPQSLRAMFVLHKAASWGFLCRQLFLHFSVFTHSTHQAAQIIIIIIKCGLYVCPTLSRIKSEEQVEPCLLYK